MIQLTFLAFIECEEYAKYVYAQEDSPAMSASASTDKVSKCGIVETPLIIGGEKATGMEFPHMVSCIMCF